MNEFFSRDFVNDILIINVKSSSGTTQHADDLSKIIKTEIKENRKKIVVDLSQCKFVDSVFLGVLIYASKELRDNDGQMRIVEPAKLSPAIFSISKSLHLLEYYRTREEALNSFSS
jgi:anti-sigma B factor antagonist